MSPASPEPSQRTSTAAELRITFARKGAPEIRRQFAQWQIDVDTGAALESTATSTAPQKHDARRSYSRRRAECVDASETSSFPLAPEVPLTAQTIFPVPLTALTMESMGAVPVTVTCPSLLFTTTSSTPATDEIASHTSAPLCCVSIPSTCSLWTSRTGGGGWLMVHEGQSFRHMASRLNRIAAPNGSYEPRLLRRSAGAIGCWIESFQWRDDI